MGVRPLFPVPYLAEPECRRPWRRLAEEIVYGEDEVKTTGASNDLQTGGPRGSSRW